MRNTTDKEFGRKQSRNGEDLFAPWFIKGFGSKFAFSARFTNFGQNIMYPYAKQKGMANIKVSVSPHGSGFSNAWQHYDLILFLAFYKLYCIQPSV